MAPRTARHPRPTPFYDCHLPRRGVREGRGEVKTLLPASRSSLATWQTIIHVCLIVSSSDSPGYTEHDREDPRPTVPYTYHSFANCPVSLTAIAPFVRNSPLQRSRFLESLIYQGKLPRSTVVETVSENFVPSLRARYNFNPPLFQTGLLIADGRTSTRIIF